MNQTNFEHAGYALLMQFCIGILTGNWWAGAAFGAAFFLGREHAQFEKKLACGGAVTSLNPFAGFAIWKWSLDSKLDFLFPVIAVLPLAIVSPYRG
jgi:hypothetical protein